MSFQTKKQLRNSGSIFSGLFFIFFVLIPFIFHGAFNTIFAFFALLILLISLFSPYRLRKFFDYWMKLGDFLAKINSVIVLGIFFYLIIFPFAFLRRLTKFICSTKSSSKISYYSTRLDNKINFKDQF